MMVGSVAVPLSAPAETSEECNPEICDPVGDTLHPHAPAFKDIVCNGIQKDEGTQTLFFSMTLAAELPESPPPAPGVKETWFFWTLDLDGAALLDGYPFIASPPQGDLYVVVVWDGTDFTGNVVDRRPLLIGEDVDITPLEFSIDGDTITAQLDSDAFDIPPSFTWLTLIRDWFHAPGTKGSEGQTLLDGGGGDGHGEWTYFESPCESE